MKGEFKRRLIAILSADVKGYSRLMGEDEEKTVRTLTAYRDVMSSLIKEHRGRVVDSPGDNILAEFSSVVDAVHCAVEIQKDLKERNNHLPKNRRMVFRIGINLGDVIQEGEKIYGDGVNIAARIEGLADPGGISISGTVYDQVENKIRLGFEYMGEHAVKNITKPVRVYRVLMGRGVRKPVVALRKPHVRKPFKKYSIALGALVFVCIAVVLIWMGFQSKGPPGLKLLNKPSIAVLPFLNMSSDPKQEYFSDGITEEIITGLSRVPQIFVIARNSAFTYKGKPVKVRQVARELGVRYVLRGSVRKERKRVRITAQLIDAATGHYIWSERYDRDLKDIFTLEDEITLRIITAMQVKLTEGEQASLWAKGTRSLEAYIMLLKGREHFYRMNREGNAEARKMFEKAISLDTHYATAYRLLGATYHMDVILGLSKSPGASLRKASEMAKRAIKIDPSEAGAHSLLARIYMMKREHEKAIDEAKKAVALNPNSADTIASLGVVLTFAGKHGEAISLFKKAIRLNPLPPSWYYHNLGNAQRNKGLYEEAISFYKKAIQVRSDNLFAYIGLASACSLLGRDKEARQAAMEVLKIDPEFSLKHLERRLPYRNQVDMHLIINALKKAGLN